MREIIDILLREMRRPAPTTFREWAREVFYMPLRVWNDSQEAAGIVERRLLNR